MTTLYELLGALPEDDAEGLRTAFRKAVKGAHPDLNPGDPDAALKFRQIVRAHEILSDDDQRATYDHLLNLAQLEQKRGSKHGTGTRVRKLASGVIALAGISVLAVGGYLAFMQLSAASAPTAHETTTAPGLAELAAALPEDTHDWNAPAAKPEPMASSDAVPSPATPPIDREGVTVGAAEPPAELPTIAARFYPVEASAFRSGDPKLVITDLDQAAPAVAKSAPVYIDRNSIFFRYRKLEHAFAEVPQVKRLEKPIRGGAASTSRPAENRLFPLSRRRTAARDASRQEGFPFIAVR